MDAFPILSQGKSLFQAICGDKEGARKTQENFSRQCPVISQGRSLCELAKGDRKAALETQKECLGLISNIADATPVVGHVKGGIHYVCGDKAGGDKAMKNASRSIGVVVGGAAGMVVAGPPGAVAGGISGGLAMDSVTTTIDSAVHKEYRPSGMIGQVTGLVKDPANPGKWYDAAMMPMFNGMAGLAAGVPDAPYQPDLPYKPDGPTGEPLTDSSMDPDDKDVVDKCIKKLKAFNKKPEKTPSVEKKDLGNSKPSSTFYT